MSAYIVELEEDLRRYERTLMVISIVAGIVCALLRGVREGMVMIKPGDIMFAGQEIGVRGHAWYGWYHAIDYAVMVGLVLFAAGSLLISWQGWRRSVVYICGIGLIWWELTELGYNYARYAQPIIMYEHITVVDVISLEIEGWQVVALHVCRAAAGVIILMGGGVMLRWIKNVMRQVSHMVMVVAAVVALSMVIVAVSGGVAEAGTIGDFWDKARGWASGELLALIATTAVTILGAASGVLYRKINSTLKEVGEFLSVLSTSLADKRVTKDEIADIVREGEDVFNLWAQTPVQYKVK